MMSCLWLLSFHHYFILSKVEISFQIKLVSLLGSLNNNGRLFEVLMVKIKGI